MTISTQDALADELEKDWAIERIILRRFRENRIDGYTKEMSEEIAALRAPNQPVARTIGVHEYLDDYEFRGEGGDYTPTDNEKELIEDAIEGYLSTLQASPPSPQETRRALEEIAATLKYSKIANSEAALMVQQIVKDALSTSPAPAEDESCQN